ncbi:lysophosphatidylcholine acyltransferase 1 [Denticeps clupeoides]|uniref:EF-hand domain-containing protein n=1 Tax=Denticeps clupeoides TaxID=299321 RepID=A0AAY4E358_9TELE|nr:lysophosphatidylcholine acyltransferase 1-like [Denticeps clupeoides]
MRLPRRRVAPVDEDVAEVSPHFRNPFSHELKLTLLQKVKITVMTLTLFPVRLFFAAFMMLLAWPFAFVATVGRSDDAVEPLCWWRWLVDLVLKAIMRAMWFSGGFHWVRVKGRPALPSKAPILTLAPHSSYFDAIPVTMTMASIVMKAENRDIPVWGTLIKFIRPVFVSRSDQDSRRKTVEEIKRRACSGGVWPQIMIFPEGTCTNRSCLITFKPGAFIPAVPVQPVVLRYLNDMDTITWTWQGPGAFKILWLTLCQLHNSMEIEYLPTYTPSEQERRNPALFANNVRRVMAKALNVPITDYSFEDCQLSMVQGPLRPPGNSCLLEFSRLLRLLGLKTGVTEEVLQDLASRAQKLWGDRLGLEDFAQHLNLPVSEQLQDIFALFDDHSTGTVDLREYVIALSVVHRPFKSLKTIKLAFTMFEEEDESITEEDLAAILRSTLGVADLDVAEVFRVVDVTNKGKITFDQFRTLVEQSPDLVDQCLFRSGMSSPSCTEIPAPPASSNGFCSDFSPHEQHCHGTAESKKLN